MRILYIHRGYFPHSAGAEIMTYTVASEMQKRGHQIGLLCQRSENTIELSKNSSIELIVLREDGHTSVEVQLPWKPDIVHVVDAVWPEPLRVARDLAQALKVPLAITPASTIDVWRDVPTTLEVCRQADLVCVLTQAEKAQFQAHAIAVEHLTVIGQGAYLKGIPDAKAFRKRYGIKGPMVLFLGRKVEFKGYKVLLEAMAHVWEQLPETSFVYIGTQVDHDCQQTFQRYTDPRVIEINAIDEAGKHSALVACDLVCLPSTADVFPLVFVEAWSCAKPVIASCYSGVEEIVRHELDGLIIEAHPHAIAAGIRYLLEHDEQSQSMGQAGWQRVQHEFTWAHVTDHIEQAYRSLHVACARKEMA